MKTNTPLLNADITEADVIAWIAAQRRAHDLPSWASIVVASPLVLFIGHEGAALFSVGGIPPTGSSIYASGDTIASAVAKFKAALPPTGSALAAQKREEAAKLLAEAKAIETDVKEAQS